MEGNPQHRGTTAPSTRWCALKLIIAGGRDYNPTGLEAFEAKVWLDRIADEYEVTRVISGCAKGADALGERWAEERGLSIDRFHADWDQLGPRAGPIRNARMAKHADALAVFPGGRGTASMVALARTRKLKIFEFNRGDPANADL